MRGDRPGRARGFTLIELVVALALVGMALAIAFGALRFATRSWERTDVLADELEDARVTRAVVRRLLVQVQPVLEDPAGLALLFRGDARHLEFVAPTPVQDGRLAGLYQYRLRVVQTPDRHALLMEYRPYHPGLAADWLEPAGTSLLVDHLAAGRFTYRAAGGPDDGAGWQARWEETVRLPALVRLELAREQAVSGWPPLVVALPVRGTSR